MYTSHWEVKSTSAHPDLWRPPVVPASQMSPTPSSKVRLPSVNEILLRISRDSSMSRRPSSSSSNSVDPSTIASSTVAPTPNGYSPSSSSSSSKTPSPSAHMATFCELPFSLTPRLPLQVAPYQSQLMMLPPLYGQSHQLHSQKPAYSVHAAQSAHSAYAAQSSQPTSASSINSAHPRHPTHSEHTAHTAHSEHSEHSEHSLRSASQSSPSIDAATPAPSHSFSAPRKRGRKRKANAVCSQCGSTQTPEWRRGPDGVRTLCNACGLYYSKLVKKFGATDAQMVFLYKKLHNEVGDRMVPSTRQKQWFCSYIAEHETE